MMSKKRAAWKRWRTQLSVRGVVLGGLLLAGTVNAEEITMASTTSTEQSGLFSQLLPDFRKATQVDVKVVAVGTGQAIDMARRGDADVLFVHDTAAEEKFVAEGYAVKRFPVMYNDFVLVGPKADPAGIQGNDIVAALKKVAAASAPRAPTCRPARSTWRSSDAFHGMGALRGCRMPRDHCAAFGKNYCSPPIL